MKAPLTTQQLSDLTGLIYDAAVNPDGWSQAAEEIRIALDFANSVLGLLTWPGAQSLFNLTTNIPPDYAQSFNSYGPEIIKSWGGWAGLRSLSLDEPVLLSRVNPDFVRFDITTSPYALEWAKPQGLIDNLALPVAMDDHAVGLMGFGRHHDAGPVGTFELEAARLLMPHLQRAITINRLLDMAALARSTFETALDTLAVPVVLTTASLRVIHMNPAARKIVTMGDLLHISHGVLSATSSGVSHALAVAVAQAVRDESALERKGMGIPARRGDGAVAALHVLPLRPDRLPVGSQPVAAIFIADASTSRTAPIELITSLFGLTLAEARVFEQIAAGKTVAETSDALAIGQSTVRTHLVHLFDKTGVRRQAELIHLATSLAVPVV